MKVEKNNLPFYYFFFCCKNTIAPYNFNQNLFKFFNFTFIQSSPLSFNFIQVKLLYQISLIFVDKYPNFIFFL